MDIQKYFIKEIKKVEKNNSMPISVALIGLGPHAKRIYLNYFKKHKINFSLLVDLESKKNEVKEYLKENNFKNTKIFTINDRYKDDEHLPEDIASNLLAVCKTLEITHLIISTEPKAHYMYLEFALKNDINVLTDKPITVNKNMLSLKSINKIREQYYDILDLAKNSKAECKVMCQRQYHKGYEYIKELLNDIVSKYKIPITYIDIYHCDGNWEMPHDLEKENHPYKYGYGKLFHSGYHFIDLLSDFIKVNNQLTGNKKIVNGEIYGNILTPSDELNICNFEDYKNIFKEQSIPSFYNQKEPDFKNYGEKNFYGMLKFTNSNGQTITNANLNLLHYGFSRRGWIETKDFYKKNGRIRHERINIQVGPLLNIQVHSYQAKEIKDRTNNMKFEEEIGGLEHFDIDIYRNVDIIGGKPFERISLGSLYSEKEKKNILGYNELSRETFLTNFFKGNCPKGDIKDQALAIEILYSCALSTRNQNKNKNKVERINLKNEYVYPININNLSRYSKIENKAEVKHLVKIYEQASPLYEYSAFINYLTEKKKYEVFLSLSDYETIVSGLLLKEFKYKWLACLYLWYLEKIIKKQDIKRITKKIELSK